MAPQGTGTVRNVVFDMGGVLLRWEPEVYARNVTDNDEDAGLVLEALFKGSAWTLSDAGVFGPETVLMEACHALPERLHGAAAEALRRFPSMQAVIPEVNELGRRLKERGYGVYILSNVSSRFRSELAPRIPLCDVADGALVSAEEHMMKPDPIIFLRFCERFGVEPASCLFVDDTAVNCVGAERAGMRAFHFTGDVDALEAEVAGLS